MSGAAMSGAHGDSPAGTSGASGAAAKDSPERAVPGDADELRQEIERTREQLGETVDQLAAKADVKQQARDKAAELRTQARDKAAGLRTRIQARATGLASRTGQLAAQAQGTVAQGAGRAPRPPRPIGRGAAAGGVLLVGYLVIRRRRSATS